MSEYARHALATDVRTDYDDVVGTGSFKTVYKGTFLNGSRTGQPCVKKCVREGCGEARTMFKKEKEIVDVAVRIIDSFNEAKVSPLKARVYMNVPAIFRDRHGARTLVEPFIRDFEKYNSNTGWASSATTRRCLVSQALSHFSYHTSGGDMLLCDLQGGRFCKGFALTDPVVCSRDRRFGPTDLGSAGIQTFFAHHTCNRYCKAHWSKPIKDASLPVCKGTRIMSATGSMVDVPQQPVNPLPVILEEGEVLSDSDNAPAQPGTRQIGAPQQPQKQKAGAKKRARAARKRLAAKKTAAMKKKPATKTKAAAAKQHPAIKKPAAAKPGAKKKAVAKPRAAKTKALAALKPKQTVAMKNVAAPKLVAVKKEPVNW